VAEGDGLLNADQRFGHRRFSSQILALQSLPRSSELAAVGSGGPVLAAPRDNFRDSVCGSPRAGLMKTSGCTCSRCREVVLLQALFGNADSMLCGSPRAPGVSCAHGEALHL
jgi:hypothetical protein